jgi:hypothetical protein
MTRKGRGTMRMMTTFVTMLLGAGLFACSSFQTAPPSPGGEIAAEDAGTDAAIALAPLDAVCGASGECASGCCSPSKSLGPHCASKVSGALCLCDSDVDCALLRACTAADGGGGTLSRCEVTPGETWSSCNRSCG